MSNQEPRPRLRGRQAEAAANDERILRAALRVLIANPNAPITAVATEAGVGVASLYRRFTSRDELARRLALHAMRQITAEAEAHLQRLPSDPWPTFVHFFVAALDAGAGSMTAFAGTFDPGEELNRAGLGLSDAMAALLSEAQRLQVVRSDINALDLMQLFQMLRAVHIGSFERDEELRLRYIDLLLPALRPGSTQPLRGPEPTSEENLGTWTSDGLRKHDRQ